MAEEPTTPEHPTRRRYFTRPFCCGDQTCPAYTDPYAHCTTTDD